MNDFDDGMDTIETNKRASASGEGKQMRKSLPRRGESLPRRGAEASNAAPAQGSFGENVFLSGGKGRGKGSE